MDEDKTENIDGQVLRRVAGTSRATQRWLKTALQTIRTMPPAGEAEAKVRRARPEPVPDAKPAPEPEPAAPEADSAAGPASEPAPGTESASQPLVVDSLDETP